MDKNDSDEDDDDGNPNHLAGLYACHSCIVFYSTLKGLKVHYDAFHRNIDSGSIEPVRIPCEQCNMTFIQRHNLDKHVQQNHGGFPRPPSSMSGSIGARSKHESGNSQSGLNLTIATSTISSTGKKAQVQQGKGQQVKVPKVPVKKPESVQQKEESTTVSTRKSPRSTKQQQQFTTSQRIYHCDECTEAFRSETALLHHKKTSHKVVVKGHKGKNVEYASSIASDTSAKSKGHYFDASDPQDVEFFSSVAQRIAENLQYHVDGRISDLKSGRSQHPSTSGQQATTSAESINKVDYLETECKLRTNHYSEPSIRIPIDDDLTMAMIKNYGHHYICSTCGTREPDVKSFYAHALNNHPNVMSNYILVEATNTVPGKLLTWKYNNPNGLLNLCGRGSNMDIGDQQPSTSTSLDVGSNKLNKTSSSVKCTKCGNTFITIDLLHGHMFECARIAHYNPVSSVHGSINRKRQPPSRSSSPENDAGTTGYSTRSGRKRTSPATSVSTPTTSNKGGGGNKGGGSNTTTSGHKALINNDADGSKENFSNELKRKVDKNTCKRCNKKFRYSDTLKKHRLSCLRLKIKFPTTGFNTFRHGSFNDKDKRLSLDDDDDFVDDQESIEEDLIDTGMVDDHDDPDFVIPSATSKSGSKGSKKSPKVSKDQGAEKDADDQGIIPADGELIPGSFSKDVSVTEDWKSDNNSPSTYAFKGSPAQHHSCPYCQRGFTYLANYSKHMKGLCPIKQQIDDAKNGLVPLPSVVTSDINKTLSPRKEDSGSRSVDTVVSKTDLNSSINNISAVSGLPSTVIDGSSDRDPTPATTINLNTKGDNKPSKSGQQSKANVSNNGFKSFSCQVCHKIYFSHLDLMKHILSHKMNGDSLNDGVDVLDQQMDSKQMEQDLLSDLANGGLKITNPIIVSTVDQQESTNCGQQLTVSEEETSAALAAGIILLDDVKMDTIDTCAQISSGDSKMVVIEDIDDDDDGTYEIMSSDQSIKINHKSGNEWPSNSSSILLR